jgi:hypothetical protein
LTAGVSKPDSCYQERRKNKRRISRRWVKGGHTKKPDSIQRSDFKEKLLRDEQRLSSELFSVCVRGAVVLRQSCQSRVLTCWVLQGGSVPSDWHTHLSSPVSALGSARVSQPQTTAFYAAHKKHLGPPGQNLWFKKR